LEKNLSALRTEETAAACNELLWETALALTEPANPENLHSALACLKLLAPGHTFKTREHPPAGTEKATPSEPPDLSPQPPPAKSWTETSQPGRALRHSGNVPSGTFPGEWNRLLQMATVLEALHRESDCALVLECAREYAPDKKLALALELRRMRLLEHLQRWSELENSAHEALLQSPAEAQVVGGILLLRATAEAGLQCFEKACKTLDEIETFHPGNPEIGRIRLLRAHTLLIAGQVPAALGALDRFDGLHSRGDLLPTARLLRTQALFQQKSHADCRSCAQKLLQRHPAEKLVPPALLYAALAAHALGDLPAAVTDAQNCLERNPEPEVASHARLVLGQSLARSGRIPEALEALTRIPAEPAEIGDAAAREIARILRTSGSAGALRDYWTRLLHERPRCGPLSEITNWVMEEAQKTSARENTRKLLWEAFDAVNAVPRCELGVQITELLEAPDHLRENPSDKKSREHAEKQLLPELRKRGLLDAGSKSPPLSRLHALRVELLQLQAPQREKRLQEAVSLALENLESIPASLLEAFAEMAGDTPPANFPGAALRLWEELLRWNPRAPQRDKACLALGLAAVGRGDFAAASEAFGRAIRECPTGKVCDRIRLERARILMEVNSLEEAERDLHAVLSNPRSDAVRKAEALVLLGEKHLRSPDPRKAIACFQRVYILYPACDTAVASAYLRSGEAFEILEDVPAARRTYSELLSHKHLHALPQSESARKNLQKLPP
jgi:tetratricopeptide (TPR) repeat protein